MLINVLPKDISATTRLKQVCEPCDPQSSNISTRPRHLSKCLYKCWITRTFICKHFMHIPINYAFKWYSTWRIYMYSGGIYNAYFITYCKYHLQSLDLTHLSFVERYIYINFYTILFFFFFLTVCCLGNLYLQHVPQTFHLM